MYRNKKFLGLITARGGSEGVPRKNIKLLGGKPLIWWTISEAIKSKYLDRLIVSTEDIEIATISKMYNCEVPFMRPIELASNTSTSFDVVKHVLSKIEGYDYLVLLQPTSPFRKSFQIDEAIELCIENECDVVSVLRLSISPYKTYRLNAIGRLEPILGMKFDRRQDEPVSYATNGALYINNIENLLDRGGFIGENTIPYIMDDLSSIDIDTYFDWTIAELLINQAVYKINQEE